MHLQSIISLLGLTALLTASGITRAQAYDPIIENFRLDQNDQLTIDRGGPVDRAGDVNGDNLEDLLVGAGVGGIRVIFGPTMGNNGVLNGQQLDGNSGFVILNDSENDSVFAGIGDINGDGLDDIAAGSVNGTHVIYGSDAGFERTLDVADLDGSNGFQFASGTTDLKRAGDVNGDGIADFIVGNGNASPNGLDGAGVSYVLFGRDTDFPAALSPSELTGDNGFALIGISAEDRAGRFVSGAGDFNNDGFDDILIGAPYKTTDGKAEAGGAYLVLGGDSFPAALSLADVGNGNGLTFNGSDIQDLAGAAVGAIGDLNHDGIDDIAIGAPSKGPFGVPSDYPGEVYVLFGGNFDEIDVVVEDDLNGINGMVLRGIRGGVIPIEVDETIWGDMAGADLDAAGDINGDGIDDLMIGAPHTVITPQRKGVGQAYFVFGSSSAFPARLNLSDLDGSNGFRINGTGTVDYYAVSLAGAGDFNADGRDDVMMGASGQGETYVFYGRDTGSALAAAAPGAAAGPVSTSFQEALLNPGVDAAPLAFNERRDPTGPDPLPPGTPTDPTDPATPGYTAPYPLNTAPVARPGDTTDSDDTDGSDGSTDNDNGDDTDDSGDDGDPDSGDNSGEESDEDTDETGDSTDSNSVVTGGGAALWLPILMLVCLRHRPTSIYSA